MKENKLTQNKAGAADSLFVPDYLREQLINITPSKEDWLEWKCSPCSKQLMLELSKERQGLLETTALGSKENFESNQGCLKEIDFVIKCINEKGE